MNPSFKVFIINVAVFCTLLVSLEVLGQVVFFAAKGHFVFQNHPERADENHHRELFEHHPYLVGRMKKNVSVSSNGITITTTGHHTRFTMAPKYDDNLIRIATLGGSTTFGTKVSDLDTWPAQLQQKLGPGYSVRNYGLPGFSTTEAVIQLALVVPEWKPHYVIFYQGWNDIPNYFDDSITPDYYNHGTMQRDNLRIPLYETKSFFEKGTELSSIFHLVKNLRYRLIKRKFAKPVLYSTPDPKVDNIYVKNLELLKVLSNHYSATPIFIPQILNDQYFLNMEETFNPWSPHIKAASMPELMANFNSLMSNICKEEDTPCMYLGSVLNVDWQENDFVDRGHFSAEGGNKFSDEIVTYITKGQP